MEGSDALLLFVGGYNRAPESGVTEHGPAGPGLHVFVMNPDDGTLEPVHAHRGIVNASFLGFDPKYRFLFVVSETEGGEVSAFGVAGKEPYLRPINSRSTGGEHPCYVSVEPSGRFLLVSNYSGGSVAVLPVNDDGSLRESSDNVQHTGSSVNKQRQGEPHPHSIVPDPQGGFILVPDLGLDRIMVYRLDERTGTLIPAPEPWVRVAPGSGPRHIDFGLNGESVYLITELGNTVVAYSYDATAGTLRERQVAGTLPEGFDGESYCADIHISPSGRFVYGSNRGHDSIAVFSIDESSGVLSLVGHRSTEGSWPRNFTLDPSGKFLLAANQKSDSIVTFRIDRDSGMPREVVQTVSVPGPACLKLVPRSLLP